ncbi:hypothetical protein [Rhodococcus sp. WB9]|nr:hypothetical protein [Rhodococcus sp. WB9]
MSADRANRPARPADGFVDAHCEVRSSTADRAAEVDRWCGVHELV